MERRKFVTGAGALATGSAAAVGTGAFSSVEAERDVKVEFAGDADAYLGITGDNTYTTDNSDGRFLIDLGGPDNPNSVVGSGFNENARTSVENVVTPTNQGTETVSISLNSPDGGKVLDDGDTVKFSIDGTVVFLSIKENSTVLAPGESTDIDATVEDRAGGGDGSILTIKTEAQE